MAQLLLFRPQSRLEEAYSEQVQLMLQWAKDGRITMKQFQNFRRQAEYNLIMKHRREERQQR